MHYPNAVTILLSLAIASGVVQADLVFNDGQQHVLSEDTFEPVIVSDLSHLIVEASIHETAEKTPLTISNATVVVNGGTLVAHRPRVDNFGPIVVENDALLRLNRGTIRDGLVIRQSTLEVNGGLIRPSDFLVPGVVVLEDASLLRFAAGSIDLGGVSVVSRDSTVEITGGVIFSDDPAITAEGSSVLSMQNGAIGGGIGSSVNLRGTTRMSMSGGRVWTGERLGTIAITLSERSKFTLSGGTIEAHSEGSGVGIDLADEAIVEMTGGLLDVYDSTAVQINDNSRFMMTGGQIKSYGEFGAQGISASENGQASVRGSRLDLLSGSRDSSAFFALASGNSEIVFENVAGIDDSRGCGLSGNLPTAAFRVEDTATMTIRDSSMTKSTCIHTPPTFFNATGSASLTIQDGVYQIDARGTEFDVVTMVRAHDDARVSLQSGSFVASVDDIRDPVITFQGLWASGKSTVEIRGGQFDLQTELESVVRHIDADDDASVTLYGSGFNFPMFEPIQATEGTITGRLLDGNDIEWNFLRGPGATILLVPEPNSTLACLFGVIGMILLTQRVDRDSAGSP